MRSIEYQIIQGGVGDIILINGLSRESGESLAPRLSVVVLPGQQTWNPAGAPAEFVGFARLNWRHRDSRWKDVLGFRGDQDVERPAGEWNRIEVICEGGDVTYFLNGVKVNEGRNGSYQEGKLQFQSEGAEIYFRRIELHPLR